MIHSLHLFNIYLFISTTNFVSSTSTTDSSNNIIPTAFSTNSKIS